MTDGQLAPWATPVYLEGSALVKLLVPEPDSDGLNQALKRAGEVIVSDLALTETASALGRRTREALLTPAESRRLYREARQLAASCRIVELTPPVHRQAERLLLTSWKIPLRALDALHVALALDAGAATLATYDPRLRQAAVAHGLFVALEA
jgi:predicted nucleic acid-binding protein